MPPLVKRKGPAPAVCKVGKNPPLLGGWWEGLPINVMLLLTVNVPRVRTVLSGVSETSSDVRNSHSASNGVIPPEEAEGRG